MGGGGLAVFGNDVFYDDGSQFMHGTFSGNTLNFTVAPLPVTPIQDMANCPGTASPTQVFQTVCGNQLPYSWNGNNYPAAGTYMVTLTGSGGCDSIVTLNLSIGSITGIPENISICNSQLPYTWNGNNYASTGTYTVTLTSSGGCDSIATLILTTGGSITGTPQNISVCPNLLPYLWNGNNYSTAGTYTVTLTSSGGCDSIATLNLTVINTITGPPQNTTICSNQVPYTWNGNNYSTNGSYTATLTSSNGCDSMATLNLTVINTITGPAQNTTICSNQLPYTWNGNNYSTNGSYNTTLTGSSGCDSIATLNLNIVNTTTGPAQNTTICSNQLPYSWNGNNYSTTGSYTATLTNSNGCDSTATLDLTVINSTTGTPENITVCASQLPYNWNGNNYTANGTYMATLAGSNGCDSIATLNLTVVNTITGTPENIAVCPDQLPYNWNGNSYPAVGIFTITLISNGGCDSIATLNLVTYPAISTTIDTSICPEQFPFHWNNNYYLIAGSYTGTFTAVSGCDSIVTVNLSVYTSPVAYAGEDVTVPSNIPYQLSGTGGIYYQWSPIFLLNDANIANPLTTVTTNTSFYLTVMDNNGCIDKDTVNIKIPEGPSIFVPSAFSPDGQMLNNIFRPVYTGIKSLQYFRIYNRYGQMVFSTTELYAGWDGHLKGQPQNTGTYVWMLHAIDNRGKIWNMRGSLVLIR